MCRESEFCLAVYQLSRDGSRTRLSSGVMQSDHHNREINLDGSLAEDLQFRRFERTFIVPKSRLLEIKPVYATLGAAFFPRCNITKTTCSEFSKTEDSSPANKSTAHAHVSTASLACSTF